MKYKFIFTNNSALGKMTYEYELESFDRTAEEMFNKACALLDFGIFGHVQMFDENGNELTELY